MLPSTRFPGSFDVSIAGSAWFVAGGPIQVRHDGATFATDGATGRRLSLVRNSSTSGSDVLGSFERVAHTWRTDGGLVFETAARRYASALVFEQRFHTAASRTGGGGLVSSFPTFGLPAAAERPPRYFVQWDGDMAGQLYKAGTWAAGARVGGGLVGTAPLVVFAEDLRTSAVVSPLSSFMVAAAQPSRDGVAYGVLGSVASVPAGFGVETVVVASRGVREAMLSWGDALLRYHGKRREAAWARDATLRHLGYATDNGAYYYYNVHPDRGPPGRTYESTILEVAAYARRAGIPYRYWLADSWWYSKGPETAGVPRPGVARWEPMREIFPRGLGALANATGWRLMAHNRYWSASTPYARQNGGEWPFELDRATGFAVPASRAFWDHLFGRAREGGWRLATYEQDWMNFQNERLPALTRSATAARAWLRDLGDAADAAGVSVQYCMSYARHVLQSVESAAVTQARGSGDYRAGNDQWQPLGMTALLLHAVGLAVSKDNLWTTTAQPGSKWGDGTREPHPRLQAAVATLSRGPVMVSDAVNRSDVALVLRSCTRDGTLLHPGAPAVLMDGAVLAKAQGRPWGELWLAPTAIGGRRHVSLFAAKVARDRTLRGDELGFAPATPLLAMDVTCTDAAADAADAAAAADADHAADTAVVSVGADGAEEVPQEGRRRACRVLDGLPTVRRCGKADFQLWSVTAREPGGGWTLLGEVGKWVAVSPARVVAITTAPQQPPQTGVGKRDSGGSPGLDVDVQGTPGERVSLAFAPPTSESAARAAASVVRAEPHEIEPFLVTCVLPASGRMRVSVPQRRDAKGHPERMCA